MKRFKVLIANPSVPKIAHKLLNEKCEVIISRGYDRTSILKNIQGIDGLFWATRRKELDKEMLNAAGPQLKVIGTMSVGYDHIDLNELKARGIKLGNTPKVSNDAVADVAILLALAASRRFTEGRWHLEQGTWKDVYNPKWMLGVDIAGSTVGVIGLGGIGQGIIERLRGFRVANILYTGPKEKTQGKKLGAEFVDIDTLTRKSDFIFLAAPLAPETDQMCNADFFSKMKHNGIFINVSRGQLVDQDALIAALKEGQIYGAGLDVMKPEPLNADNELLKLPNIVLTPHIGASTKNTRNAMAELTVRNILLGLDGKEMLTPVHL